VSGSAPVIEAIEAVLQKTEGLVAAWVFGSMARGDASASSDLDLAVLMSDPSDDAAEETLRGLAADLERHSPCGRVDIVVLGAQGPVFRHRVLREGKLVLDRDPPARHAFEARTIVEYLDWRPTHDIAMAAALDGLRRRFVGEHP
jgi:uncharacterized protein